MFERLHCWIWIRICYVQAYLALQRGDKIESAEWELDMVRYEREIERMEVCNVR